MANAVVGALNVVLGIDTAVFREGLQSATKSLKQVGAQMTSIGQSLSLTVSAPLAAVGGVILNAAGNFEAAMNRIEAASGASGDEMAALSDLAREMGQSTKFSATEAAEAIEMLVKNGQSASQILGGSLAASLDMAAASGSDLAGAADLMTDIMANFGKEAGDLNSVIDGVTGALIESKFGFDDYRLALGQAGGVAGAFGVELSEFNAVIAATSAAFASGSDAGTSFKTFLQRLVPASDPAAVAMEKLGLEFFDAQGNMKSMAEIAQELQDGLRGLSDEAQNDALSTIFGTDALRTAVGLAREGAAGIRELDAAIGEASAAEQAAARMEGFSGAMERLQSALEGLGLAIAQSGLLDFATRAAEGLSGVVNWLSEADPALMKFGTVIAGVGVAMGPVLIGLGLMATAIGAVGIPAAAVVVGITALTAAVVAFWPEIKSATEAVKAFGRDALDWITAKVEEIPEIFRAIPETMGEIGIAIMQGLWQGITGQWEGLKENISGLASSISERFKSVLGIHSPSRVFAEIGTNIMEGLGQGIGSMAGDITGQVQGMAQSLSSLFADVLFNGADFVKGMQSILANVGGSLANKAIGMGLSAIGLPSFDGGGYTGAGPRSGGLDGKGGFLAMMHPRETVTDHAKGGGSGGVEFHLHDHVGVRTETERQRGPNGQEIFNVHLREALSTGAADGALRGRHGLRPQRVKR